MQQPRFLASPQSRPFLVENRSAPATSRSPLLLWHLLSLDAPTVAAVWTYCFSWCAGVNVRRLDLLAMFVAVWILYAGDRLLDARPLFTEAHAPEIRAHHRFHHRHRSAFLTAILLGCLVLLALLHWTGEALLHRYALLAVLLSGWLLLVHARAAPAGHTHRLPKELVVGPFFAAAVCIPTVAQAPSVRLRLLPLAALFALLCGLNCLFLYAWEHPHDRSGAHPATRWGVRFLPQLAGGLIALTAAGSLWALSPSWHALPHTSACLLCLCGSAGALLLLHVRRQRLPALLLRTLADLVLLTPVLVISASWAVHRVR